MSDIHLEFEDYYKDGNIIFPNTYFSVPEHEGDSSSILILAGDVGLIRKKYTYMHFLENVGKRFLRVIYVPGNHEYYRGVHGLDMKELKENLSDINVSVLDNDSVRIGNQLIVGATMWTDFDRGNPLIMMKATGYMSDYSLINHVNENGSILNITPEYILSEHKKTIEYLHQTLANSNGAIVVTHHLPSFRSVCVRKWGYHFSNHLYYSDLDEMIMNYKPKAWFHGHTHDSCNYVIGETNVLCNPRGYKGHDLNLDFDPNAFVFL
jgi:Icc-related predicted phosphoesterase